MSIIDNQNKVVVKTNLEVEEIQPLNKALLYLLDLHIKSGNDTILRMDLVTDLISDLQLDVEVYKEYLQKEFEQTLVSGSDSENNIKELKVLKNDNNDGRIAS